MTMIDNVEHITVKEAAEILGITTQAVYRLASRGTLTERRPMPRKVYIPRAEVMERLVHTAPSHEAPINLLALRQYIIDRCEDDDTTVVGPELLNTLAWEFISVRRAAWSVEERRAWADRAAMNITNGET